MNAQSERSRTIHSGTHNSRRRRVKNRLSISGIVLILSALILSGCGQTATQPAVLPTAAPTEAAVDTSPLPQPTAEPQATPTVVPTAQPTLVPTVEPTPTQLPTTEPTVAPPPTPAEAAMEPAEVAAEEIADWQTYTNEQHGYTLRFPLGCTFGPMPAGCKQQPPEQRPAECLCFLNAEDPDRVLLQAFTGEGEELKLASFSVARLAMDPPDGADLVEFMRDKRPGTPGFPESPNATVGGLPALRLYTPGSPMAYSSEEILFIKEGNVLQIQMLDVDDPANRALYDRICSALDMSVTEAVAPAAGQPVVAWMGHVVSLPAGGQFDDYLALEPEGSGGVGLAGADNTVDAQIQRLRDSDTYAHFWGTLNCPAIDYGGCQLVVTRLREDRPGPGFSPDRVEGWEGTLASLPPGSQFDDHFRLAGNFGAGYGIDSTDPAIAGELTALRDTGTVVRIWGEVVCPAIDTYGTSISVSSMETVGAPPFSPETSAVDGWVGMLTRLPPGAQLSGYFERDDGQRFGISSLDEALRVQLEDARWTGAQVRVSGQLLTGVPDVENRQIQVERIETLSEPTMEPRNLSPFAFPSASSVLPSDRWGSYGPWAAIDGLLSTPWVEAASGPGVGEWIMLTFPSTIEVHRIGLDVGYDRDEGDTFRNENLFSSNNRVKRATVKFSSGKEIQLSFADERGVQMRDIDPVDTTYVQVVIDEVYPGAKWDDTCVAQMEVWARTK
jgi:hypothetical protein